MVNSEIIEIILRAVDNASGPAKTVDDAMKKFGDTASQANQKAANAGRLTQQQMTNLAHNIKDVIATTDQVGAKGAAQFQRYNKGVQDSVVAFNRLDAETQNMLRYLSQMSDKGREAFLGMSTKAQEAVAKFHEMQNATNGWGNTLDITKTKMQMMGTNTDSLRGKIQVVGTAITTHLGNKWDSLKTKVTNFGNYLKTHLGNALTSLHGKIEALGSAFSGLGGIISSAIGGLGMASLTQMTVGLAMNRERMTALTSATMGSAAAGKEFVGVMDNLTNTSLVSLDDLGQAMSTIKMSTGMTNEQLKSFTTTVNDVGQRAILMGKSGDEAMALMQAAGRGLNGEFDMLKTNFGITADKLKELGWSGAADDVEGYQKALNKALEAGGSMNGMMDTSVGHIETLKKNFRVAGRHVGEMFTPYIDQAVQALNGLNNSCPGLFENLVMIAGAISGFATIAPSITPALQAFDMLVGKGKSVLQFLGLMKAEEGALTAATIYNSVVTKVSAAAHAIYATIVGILTGEITLVSAATAVWNAILSANPIMLVVLAVIALVVAIYEVGKAFGWWSNVQEMLAAVWAGIQRLWDAFINHPDVQAIISALSGAWQWLCDAVGQAWQAVSNFFNLNTGGQFDVVHAIIEGIGFAWQALTGHIRLVILVITTLAGAFSDFYNGTLVPFGSYIMEVLGPVFEFLGSIWSGIVEQVQPIIDVFAQFQAGQTGLLEVVSTVASSLWNIWVLIATQLSTLVLQLVSNLLTWAIQAGANFLNGIILYLSQLPGRVGNYLLQTTTRVITAGTQWVTQARTKANQMVTGVISFISQLPSRALAQLVRVVSSIVSAGAQWISSANAQANSIVSGVVGILSGLAGRISGALSGVVNAIVSPFRSAYDSVVGIVNNLKNQVQEGLNYIGQLGNGAAGGEIIAAGGESVDVITGRPFNIVTGTYTNEPSRMEVEVNEHIILDFANVPAHIDTDTLAKAIQDRDVLKALTTNRTFQDLDANIKSKIEARNNRSRGA